MKRRVLLLEPNYRNKYPPMGLMKLAMYHRLQGYDVVFYKGDLPNFVFSQVVGDALAKLAGIDNSVDWYKYTPEIRAFIQHGKITPDPSFEQATQRPYVMKWLEHFRKFYRTNEYFEEPRWDRVCVTTLFTFYWDITVETILFAKRICKSQEQVLVGGILASVVPDKLEAVTEIKPYKGCLNISKLNGDKLLKPPFRKMKIDELPLDYSILEEIDYRYPATDAYYAYTTRGCVNKCKFCAVPILEPGKMKHFSLKSKINEINERFGKQRHLLLLDNNVFASKKFLKIIDEIRDSGFGNGATFVPPNQLEIAVRQLHNDWNNRAYIRLAVRLLNAFVEKLDGERHDRFYGLLLNHGLLHDYTATKKGVLAVYEEIRETYEKAHSKKPVIRFIDFNQGMDARLATPEKIAKLATVAIRPLRIAFDTWEEHQHYVNAVYLAKKNGITQMSNYLLYNFNDEPIDLYRRLRLNIDLCDELGVNIYSFPMKYHPIMDERWFSNRDYISPKWTRKAIRTVQAVLNSTHGKIGRGRSFFFKAFGRTEDEFLEMIQMPEAFIIKRWDAELCKDNLTNQWREAYQKLTHSERVFVNRMVAANKFNPNDWTTKSEAVRKVLDFHLIPREGIPLADEETKCQQIQNYEKSCSVENMGECLKMIEHARQRYSIPRATRNIPR